MPLYAVWIADLETRDDALSISASNREEAAEAFATSLIDDGANFTSILATVLADGDDPVNANTYEVFVDYSVDCTAYRRYKVDGVWLRADEAEAR